MSRWRYKLESTGKQLREGLKIEEETIQTIILTYNNIIICLNDLKSRLTKRDKEDWEYNIDDMVEDLEMAKPEINQEEFNYENEEENVNCYLTDFYDLCDHIRVCVGLLD